MNRLWIIVVLALGCLGTGMGFDPKTKWPQSHEVDVIADCGAVGDGCTDDADAINECLQKHAGKTIRFPRMRQTSWSDYFAGSTIDVPADTTLVGEGAGKESTRITFTPACESPDIHPTDDDLPGFDAVLVGDRSSIRDMRFSGALWCDIHDNRFSKSEPIVPINSFDGLKLNSWTTLSNVYVCGFGGDGIEVRGDGASLRAVQAWQNYGAGFHFPPVSDSHVTVCHGCTAYYNQIAGVVDNSLGNTFIGLLTEGNAVDSVVTADRANSIFISPWFEGLTNPPSLGAKTIVIGGLSGAKPDLSREPIWIDATPSNGPGGVLELGRLRSREPKWEDNVRTGVPSPYVFGTGTPVGFQAKQSAWFVNNTDTLGTVAFGELEPGWWCNRAGGYDQAGHPFAGVCVGDGTTGGTWQTRTWVPHGLYIGDGLSENRVKIEVAGTAPSGACDPEDGISFADSFVVGEFIGWACADDGTWHGFGRLE